MKYRILSVMMFISLCTFGQRADVETPSLINIGLEYGYQIPGGDLVDRFDNSSALGVKFEYLFPNNLSISGHYSFFFGRNVKEDPLLSLRNSDSLLIGNNFSQANIFLRQRGFYFGGALGKLFPVSKSNPRSGIKIELGLGLLQHKIRIQEDPESFVPVVGGDYKKGYDRLTNGLALRQFIGYQYHSLNQLVNFYAGLEFSQGFTQNRRSYNYDLGGPDETKRLDLITSIKFGWMITIYSGDTGEEIYY
jgi:hypothetical protein